VVYVYVEFLFFICNVNEETVKETSSSTQGLAIKGVSGVSSYILYSVASKRLTK